MDEHIERRQMNMAWVCWWLAGIGVHKFFVHSPLKPDLASNSFKITDPNIHLSPLEVSFYNNGTSAHQHTINLKTHERIKFYKSTSYNRTNIKAKPWLISK